MPDLTVEVGDPTLGAFFGPATVPAPAVPVGGAIVVLADVDYVNPANLLIDATTNVVDLTGAPGWTLIGQGGANPMAMKAWIGRATGAPGFITVRQGGNTSGLHVHAWPLTPAGSGVSYAVDGFATNADTTSPFEHASVSPAGALDALFCAHGMVQFVTDAVCDYGDPPAGMVAAENHGNSFSGMQSCAQLLSAAGATGPRQQTGTPASGASGGAGLMFAVRATGTPPEDPDPEPVGPEPGRMLLTA